MSFPAKRQHEEVAAEVGGVAEGSVMVMEEPGGGGGEEARPAKVARLNNDREVVEGGESVVYGNGGGAVEVVAGGEGKRSMGEEVQQQQQGNVVVVEFGLGLESDREGRDPGRTDLESGGNENGGEESCVVEEEVLGRVNVKGDEQQQQQQRESNCAVAQEFVDSNCREVNSEGLREASPPGGEGKVVVKDVALDAKKEAGPHEKEIETKDEKQSECKEEALTLVLQQQPQVDFNSEKDNERDREKVEKEKERARERERERPRDNEMEAAALTEKREKREKERDRDPHQREREEREKSLADKVIKEVGKPVKLEDVDMDRKAVDERKLVEKEGRERVRERERNKDKEDDGEGEKRKKRVREQEKDRDSFDAEGVGGERDKDTVHGNGVQQRKRLLRSRGQPNPSHRDSRSRFRPKDNEVTQGKPESSFIKYKAGDGMPELARLWKEHESVVKNSSANGSGPTVEIRIPAEFATTANRQIRGSQLWGTDIYTDDSDIVAVLFHTGYYTPSATPPPNSISELRATIRILESLKMYTSTLRNSLRSRAWGGASGCSYSVESCRIMKQGGGSVELEPCLARTPQVAPTLAPAASERTVTTRAASSSAYRQQRLMQEVTIQYNLCNEPWAKYSMSIVADRGLKKSQFTSARLKNGEVLYVETHVHRYELAYEGERTSCNGATTSFPQAVEKVKEKSGSAERASEAGEKEALLHTLNGDKSHGNHHPHNGQVGGHHAHIVIHHPHEYYRWSKCKRPLPLSSMKRKGLPLPEEFVEVLEEGLAWEEVQWSPTSVWVRGVEYILNRAQFFSPDEV